MSPDQEEELPRVTLSLLRRADQMCPRRLQHEHGSGRKLSALGDAGFEVANRIVEDATLWHKGRVEGDPTRVAFPEPSDVSPEQAAFYNALGRGYLATFPDSDVDVAELGWSTDVDELGVRLVGQVGIALTHRDGQQELRVMRVGRRGALIDDIDLHFTTLRIGEWAEGTVNVIAFDPLNVTTVECEIDVDDRMDAAQEWLTERVAIIRERADRNHTTAGADCRYCSCIPGCPQVTKRS